MLQDKKLFTKKIIKGIIFGICIQHKKSGKVWKGENFGAPYLDFGFSSSCFWNIIMPLYSLSLPEHCEFIIELLLSQNVHFMKNIGLNILQYIIVLIPWRKALYEDETLLQKSVILTLKINFLA